PPGDAAAAPAHAPTASAPNAKGAAGGRGARPRPSLGGLVVALGLLAGLVLAAPFLAGFGNLIGWLIIGFALYEAWKINRRRAFDIKGPFRLEPRRAPAPAAIEPA